MNTVKVWAVIHHLNGPLTLEQAHLALDAGAYGVFLISHEGADHELPSLATAIKSVRSADGRSLCVGINLLTEKDPTAAFELAAANALDAVWIDEPGIVAGEARAPALKLARARDVFPGSTKPRVFASVAFKYQAEDPTPAKSARAARALGFTPTTSGKATGQPPTVEKIQLMRGTSSLGLAVASGMSPENIASYSGLLSDVLVATGVSLDEHRFDYEKLRAFVHAASGT
ncbi:hypothetical protein LJR118_006753 [Acidovorax sp. LjRoot118]|uniref:hypothetical protein n=1 Tax=Acidovorax sp. LjRoot118 TaxID=3342256 RepID=UPI003ECE5F3F